MTTPVMFKSKYIIIFNFSEFKRKANTGEFQKKGDDMNSSIFFYNDPYDNAEYLIKKSRSKYIVFPHFIFKVTDQKGNTYLY